MNIGALWDQLVGAVCRPPRDTYNEDDLVGGQRAAFAFGQTRPSIKKYYRQDVELINPRGLTLKCSHYRPCVVTSTDGRLPCVIYCHTNSGSRRDAEEILFHLLPKGITVFALDFSGSGQSDGEWVTLGAHEVDDLATAVDYLREEGSTSTLAIWGRSMGAVTGILYSHRDPSIAGVVADSAFSRLTDLMLELGTDSQQGLSVPRPLVKVALTMMRRSVRRRAGFSIDDVSPLDKVPETFVPTLFGHASEDTFVAPHHSERLFVAHGADAKNFISFEGDHNGMRPEFWYHSAVIFLLSVLRVEELVGPDIDLNAIDLDEAPHMRGKGIYVAGHGSSDDVMVTTSAGENHTGDGDGNASSTRVTRSMAAPWDISNTMLESGGGGEGMGDSRRRTMTEVASIDRPASLLDVGVGAQVRAGSGEPDNEEGAEDEDALLQQVIALSLAEAAGQGGEGGAGEGRGTAHATVRNRGGWESREGEDAYDEEAAFAAAIAESLRTIEGTPSVGLKSGEEESASGKVVSSTGGVMVVEAQDAQQPSGHAAACSPVELKGARGDFSCSAASTEHAAVGCTDVLDMNQLHTMEHSTLEAAAVHAVSDEVHHALEDARKELRCEKAMEKIEAVTASGKDGADSHAGKPNNDDDDGEEELLQKLRAQGAKLSGYTATDF